MKFEFHLGFFPLSTFSALLFLGVCKYFENDVNSQLYWKNFMGIHDVNFLVSCMVRSNLSLPY